MTVTQIILVSDQAAPAFLPALDSELKPDQAVLVVTPGMARKGRDQHLDKLLRANGISVLRHALPEQHEYALIEESLTTMALRPELESGTVYLNLTGGTKLMALAAQNVARHLAPHWRSFYMDLETDRVLWIGKEGWPQSQPPQPRVLDSSVRIPSYLRGYGYEVPQGVQRPGLRPAQRDLIQEIVLDIPSLAPQIGRLNAIAQDSEDQRLLSVARGDDRKVRIDRLLELFQQAGSLNFSGDKVTFASEAERDFVKGGWLERHVFETVSALHGDLGIRDKALGLLVREGDTATVNELDVCFLHRNHFYVIECKTARMNQDQRANDILYKLESIHSRVGGLGARGMLVSYREVSKGEGQLARALGVRVVQGAAITNLRSEIARWVRG
jgi:hypothetical protein